MEALKNAQDLWNNPGTLIDLWAHLDSKKRHEELISSTVGHSKLVADLGCGSGRYSDVLSFDEYQGYDGSIGMIREALSKHQPNITFSCVDVFNFVSDFTYDTVIMIDVAHHQDFPIEAIERVVRNWKADRYFFTLLVGNKVENLFSSTVVSFTDFLTLVRQFKVKVHEIEVDENVFSWVFFEVIC